MALLTAGTVSRAVCSCECRKQNRVKLCMQYWRKYERTFLFLKTVTVQGDLSDILAKTATLTRKQSDFAVSSIDILCTAHCFGNMGLRAGVIYFLGSAFFRNTIKYFLDTLIQKSFF